MLYQINDSQGDDDDNNGLKAQTESEKDDEE